MLMSTYAVFDFMARYAWAFWLLPPLLWLGLRPWLRRLDRCRSDRAYARAVRASRRFHRTCGQDEESAWLAYLADRFNLTAEAVTFESIVAELRRHRAPDDLVQAIRERFDRQDTEHYAPEGQSAGAAPTARSLVHQLERSVKLLSIVACLFLAVNGWAATPQDLFDQAMELRTEKPDEARPLFTEAALGFDSEGHHFNAGNSWFFAGKPGRALASYRAAQRLRPFNRQLRESIGFIRSQRADVFHSGEGSVSRLALRWRQFCQWSPALRGGLITLAYLVGWGLFLAARITGRTVPRRAWIVLTIVALVPCVSLLRSLVQAGEGVVIEAAEGRLGPGYAYDSAYESILHESTEFEWVDARNGWVLARLPDDNEAWLRESACVRVK